MRPDNLPLRNSEALLFVPFDRNILNMVRNVRSDVEPGQRFKHNGVAWEVVELRSVNGISHVRIVRVGDPNELKLISVSALLERYDFALE